MDKIPEVYKESDMPTYFSKLSTVAKNNLSESNFLIWLSRIGITSRITFKHILSGKRRVNNERFKAALDLGFAEERAFDSLSDHSVSTLSGLNHNQTYCMPETFFATPLNTIILNLCGLEVRMDRSKIQAILSAAFSHIEIEASITLLISEHLVAEDSDERLKRIFSGVLTTLPGAKSVASRDYFKFTNELNTCAWEIPLELREMQSFSLRINKGDIALLKDLVRNFRRDCTKLSSRSDLNAVYQCSVAAIPIYLDSYEIDQRT